jgi:hypothetical protein
MRRAFSTIVTAGLFFLVPVGIASSQTLPKDSGSVTQARPPSPLSVGGKLRFQLLETFGPLGLLGAASSAGLNQWRDYPTEWGQGAKGYGRRFGSRLGQNTAMNFIQFGVGAALREDPRYFLSEGQGIFPRVGHAIASTFVARTDDGGRRIAVSEFAGVIGGEFISNTWYPKRLATTTDALRGSIITFGFDAGRNIFREFWPDIRKIFLRR